MAGNLVKWWKHKILGGYKQFSVQECTTDSEELMYNQVRASSSCSAPPDLLLVGDRENNIPLRSDVVNVINATTPTSVGSKMCPVITLSNNNQKQYIHSNTHQQQQQHQTKQPSISYNCSKETNGKHQQRLIGNNKQMQQEMQQPAPPLDNEVHNETQHNHSSTRPTHHQQPRSEEHIRLEEFTCDVSVEGGKSSQPLQFSFTFYDLDGHHGKITKDDIVGIVYTIYESIGKSVVVPHSGSKTINVRLTVSPEGKSKASKVAKKAPPTSTLQEQNTTSHKGSSQVPGRRLHRYRPRKLVKSDEEDDDSNSEKDHELGVGLTNANVIGQHQKTAKSSRSSRPQVIDQPFCSLPLAPPSSIAQTGLDINHESIYDQLKKGASDTCRECLAAVEDSRNTAISPSHNSFSAASQHQSNKGVANEAYMKHVTSTRIKLLRKSRKQKYQQDSMETRQRSLSVGNETCWKNRHLQKPNADVIDGVQLRNPLRVENTVASQNRNSAECWKTAFNRNDLIMIIRESMEKNRLCFQLNGKPQANVSPIRQTPRKHQQQPQTHNKHSQSHARHQPRQRSNTVSKIPMLIANHNNRSISSTNNNDSTSPNDHQNSNSIYHLQPHIPIYHHQMGINPTILPVHNGMSAQSGAAVAAAGQHSKINLCGYDSFLHAKICGGGLSQSPPPHSASNNQTGGVTLNSHNHNHRQQIATVQPIMSSLTNNTQIASKHVGSSQIRTSKILRSGSYSQSPQTANTAAFLSSQNSPQYHGYQRLSVSNKQNLTPLKLMHHSADRSQTEMSEKWRKDQIKNYDQLLYAKLTEKLQQTSLASTNKESSQRRKHRVLRRRSNAAAVAQAHKVCVPTISGKSSDYITLGVDPVECENLIGQTSDDDSHSHHEIEPTEDTSKSPNTRHVAEGTLVDLDDEDEDVDDDDEDDEVILDVVDQSNAAKLSVHGDILGAEAEHTDELQPEDELEIDDELEEDLADLEEIVGTESGRNSVVSNDLNGATLANTNDAANTSAGATSSLVHRYVHIHHHYHHFEEDA